MAPVQALLPWFHVYYEKRLNSIHNRDYLCALSILGDGDIDLFSYAMHFDGRFTNETILVGYIIICSSQ